MRRDQSGAGTRAAGVVREPTDSQRTARNGVLAGRLHLGLKAMSEPLLVRAARREPVERTPVWFMRQAGRSLPEYRELRRTHGLFDIVRDAELCAEVTLQPVRRHDVDAAVMFADIMLPVLGMGVDVDLVENVGPVVARPVASGADVIQLFDSWVGALSVADYEEFVAPYSARILRAVHAPTIHFGTGTAHLLGAMRDAGGDVIGLDWRIPLDRGWAEVGEDRGVQGNLDPAVLLGPWERVEAGAENVLRRAAGRPGHVFNLGHGVLPDTDPAALGRLCALVHERTAAVPA